MEMCTVLHALYVKSKNKWLVEDDIGTYINDWEWGITFSVFL